MAVEILKFEFCHLFFAVNPLVPVVVACAVCRNSGIIVPKKAVARLRVVVLKPVVHTTGVVGTFHGKEPYSGPIPKGVFGVNQNVTAETAWKPIDCSRGRKRVSLMRLRGER